MTQEEIIKQAAIDYAHDQKTKNDEFEFCVDDFIAGAYFVLTLLKQESKK